MKRLFLRRGNLIDYLLKQPVESLVPSIETTEKSRKAIMKYLREGEMGHEDTERLKLAYEILGDMTIVSPSLIGGSSATSAIASAWTRFKEESR
jgi:hypothetical protein